MGLRVRTNIASLKGVRELEENNKKAGDSMARLASGQRINKAADDAAGLAISEGMRAKIRSMSQAKRNAGDSVSMIQVAEGGMSEINNMMIRLRELAVQAASDTIGNTERGFANREYTQLVDEIDRIANTTIYNEYKLLAGAEANNGQENLTFHISAGDGKIPNTDTIELNIEKINLNVDEVLGLGRASEIGPMETSEDFDRQEAANKLSIIDNGIRLISSHRSELGAKQSRLESAIRTAAISVENTSASNSRIRDVDFAAETATFTQQKILGQAGVSVLSHANVAPEVALALLR